MSLSQLGSHEEISLVTNFNLSDTSGVTRCTQSTYLNGTSGSGSFLHRTEIASMFQGLQNSFSLKAAEAAADDTFALALVCSCPDRRRACNFHFCRTLASCAFLCADSCGWWNSRQKLYMCTSFGFSSTFGASLFPACHHLRHNVLNSF